MGDYTLTDDFYVVGLGEIDTMLDIQWLRSLGRYIQDFRRMELELTTDGKKVVLALSYGRPMVVPACRMESLFRHNGVAWAAQCFISSKSPTSPDEKSFHIDVQTMMDKHGVVLGNIPPARPPNHGFEHVIKLEEGAKFVITTS